MELERRRNLDVPELKRLGYHFMVAQTHLKHVAPLRYNDRVRVSVWVTECTYRLEFEYEIFNVTADRRAATARSILVVMSQGGEMCMRTPDVVRERISGKADG
jgi:acyl-CoA thioester hydrolase